MDARICDACKEKPARKGGRQCSACYARRYRSSELVRAKHRDAVRAYGKRNPEKRRRWVRAWRQRTGGGHTVDGAVYFYQHDTIKLLYKANRQLEQALATATRRKQARETNEHGGDDGSER